MTTREDAERLATAYVNVQEAKHLLERLAMAADRTRERKDEICFTLPARDVAKVRFDIAVGKYNALVNEVARKVP